MNARDVIARTTGMCVHSTNHGSAHDHAGCLAEADLLIESLRLAGYRIVGVTQLPELFRAAKAVHGADGPCNNDLCVCRPRS